jgi:hypothetical protein
VLNDPLLLVVGLLEQEAVVLDRWRFLGGRRRGGKKREQQKEADHGARSICGRRRI